MRSRSFDLLWLFALLFLAVWILVAAAHAQETPTSVLPPKRLTVSALPYCGPLTTDLTRKVTDSKTTDTGAVLTGGGFSSVWAQCNGTVWVVSGLHMQGLEAPPAPQRHPREGGAKPLKLKVKTTLDPRLPSPKLTPGALSNRTKANICSTSTKEYRATSLSLKKQICGEYQIASCPAEGKMEIDHLVPLELGGADTKENLWVQMAPDYHRKDLLENELHRRVCAGTANLIDAQNCIRGNWLTCFAKTFGSPAPGGKK